MYLQVSLGSWNTSIYKGVGITGKEIDYLFQFGRLFHVTFLLLNNVLLVNFVIAILSATFAVYE